MIRFSRAALATAAALSIATPLAAQIEPNSSYFHVENYYYPSGNGDWLPYRVSGFAQVPAPGIAPIVFVFPTVTIEQKNMKYYRPNGLSFDPRSEPDAPVGLVTIKPTHVATLPNATQIPAIASTLGGSAAIRYYAPAARTNGAPSMLPEAAGFPPVANAILTDYAAYDQRLAEQKALTDKYASYDIRNATLVDVEVQLLIAGEVAASRKYGGTTTNLGPITLLAPTEFQKNLLLEGDYEVLVTSRFRDTKTNYISAHFDAVQAVHSFVEETQSAITKSKASGFQIFGLGSRRTKMKTSIDQSLKTNDDVAVMQNTRVVMYDASDDMVEEFEAKFFPALSRQDTIDRHLAAAAEAEALGNQNLAQIHRDYAAAITNDNQMQEVDSVAAAAALSAGDYAGFLAHGVRSINSSDTRANSFRRVETRDTTIRQATNWDQTRTVTVMREMSVPVTLQDEKPQAPRIGLCGQRFAVPFVWVNNQGGWPQPVNSQGLMITCVEDGSPALTAGLLPGMLVRAIGDTQVSSFAELDNAVKDYQPGDAIDFWVVQAPTPGNPFSSSKRITIFTKKGWPLD
jgi:hypothetical protein